MLSVEPTTLVPLPPKGPDLLQKEPGAAGKNSQNFISLVVERPEHENLVFFIRIRDGGIGVEMIGVVQGQQCVRDKDVFRFIEFGIHKSEVFEKTIDHVTRRSEDILRISFFSYGITFHNFIPKSKVFSKFILADFERILFRVSREYSLEYAQSPRSLKNVSECRGIEPISTVAQFLAVPSPQWNRTPIDTEKKLGPEGSLVTDPTLYHSLAGSLQYLTFTRPNLSYAVQQLCLYMHDPREPHLNAMKHVLYYLRGTTDLGLQLFRSTTSQLIAYFDAEWAGCPATRRYTSGYCVFLGDNLLTWSSKRQDTLSHSSAEAEYYGVANTVAETSWIHNLLRELYTLLFTATLVYCDNVSAVYMSVNLVQHQRTKHIEIDIHFVHDKVAAGHVLVLPVHSRLQYADIFAKRFSYPLFADFRSSLSIRKTPAPTAGAY
uniref:Ribonuclease H-like domain-containing protein n=1 Tax=Tanacetum cinerariifolium TaxID=118510 RepID=A0A6L2LC31_TANCI|nr:ribonuclease H-like domain-containing protein [Tanacetum cinerariifolium]